MTVEENKALARRFIDAVFNRHEVDAIDQMMAPDAIDHSLGPGVLPSVAGIKQSLQLYLAAFPDLRATIEDIIAEGDKVVTRVTYTGTHQGPLLGMPPTGKTVTVAGIDISRIKKGRFVEHWGQIDMLGLMQQLGAIPAPGHGG